MDSPGFESLQVHELLFSQKVSRPTLGLTQSAVGKGVFFLEIKQLVHDVDHSPAPRDKVMNEWSYISTPAICLHAMSRDNFTYYLLPQEKREI